MTTFAEKLKHTSEEFVLREATRQDEEKKRVLKEVMDAVLSASKHAAQSGFLECEIHYNECFDLNVVHRHRVVPAVLRELNAMGFNRRKVSWQFDEVTTDRSHDKGRHLVLTLGWDAPLDQNEVSNLLHPPQVAKETP